MKEHIPLLQTRNRWNRWIKNRRNFKPGDVVLVADDTLPRGQWPLGVIQSVRTGHDGLVRTVEVRTQNSVKRRPVTRLCLLEGV